MLIPTRLPKYQHKSFLVLFEGDMFGQLPSTFKELFDAQPVAVMDMNSGADNIIGTHATVKLLGNQVSVPGSYDTAMGTRLIPKAVKFSDDLYSAGHKVTRYSLLSWYGSPSWCENPVYNTNIQGNTQTILFVNGQTYVEYEFGAPINLHTIVVQARPSSGMVFQLSYQDPSDGNWKEITTFSSTSKQVLGGDPIQAAKGVTKIRLRSLSTDQNSYMIPISFYGEHVTEYSPVFNVGHALLVSWHQAYASNVMDVLPECSALGFSVGDAFSDRDIIIRDCAALKAGRGPYVSRFDVGVSLMEYTDAN